ncbi:MAG: folylpolyglutamate synthase/dihydrofolate synthase family protein [Desulfomonilaceae bacterium]|nr:folylpolyglutamate synthase/dihydrofolate synthase family protein [Desulfomonilaceae bacterium]
MLAPSELTKEEQYNETVKFLYGLERFGILLGLENISLLLERMGNPQLTFPVVHVAGSNGKGSTSCFVSWILREAGLRTALYTSPHLNDFRERIRIDGAKVSKEAVVESTERVRSVYDPDRTTFFEFTTAVAFDCIAKARPEVAVIEVGLGGRLDATNTTRPAVTVITDISREHEDYLGVGIASVAREKAGIIKERIPVITGAARRDARHVIHGTAAERGSRVREFGRDFRGIRTGPDRFRYESERWTLDGLTPPRPVGYQMKNASLAVAVAEELVVQGYDIPEPAVRRGIENGRFPGRFETLRRRPDVLIDGAHTAEGMRLLKNAFRTLYPGVRPLLLLGLLKDKNYDKLARIIAPAAAEVVCVRPQGDRSLDPEVLAAIVESMGIPVETAPSIPAGFERLMGRAAPDDVVLAAGSLYMIGPVRLACGVDDA